MSDSHVLWIIAILVALDLLLSWKESKATQAHRRTVLKMASEHRSRIEQQERESFSAGRTILFSIGGRLGAILGKEEQILVEIDDLKQAVTDLLAADSAVAQAIQAAAAELQALETQLKTISSQAAIDPHDVENAAQSIKTVTTHLGAAVTALAGIVPAPAAPTATSGTSAAPATPATPAAAAASGS